LTPVDGDMLTYYQITVSVKLSKIVKKNYQKYYFYSTFKLSGILL